MIWAQRLRSPALTPSLEAALARSSVVARDAPDGISRLRLNPALPVNPIGVGAAWGWNDCENRPGVDQEAGSEASDDIARAQQWLAHPGLRHASTSVRLMACEGLGA